MADPRDDGAVRLDSWKAIARYLNRDVATARRWEKELGLPVRRIPGGRGRSVFAYTSEIDRWLAAAPAAAIEPAPMPARRMTWPQWMIVIALTAAVGATVWRATTASLSADDLRVDITQDGVVAFDATGKERWRHVFPAELMVHPIQHPVVAPGPDSAVYAATVDAVGRADRVGRSGELLQFDLKGRLVRSFSFDDQIALGGKPFGPPWALTSFAIDERGGRRRIAVAAHHYTWHPSLVTILEDGWQRRGTFVHAGWIVSVHWLTPDQLLIGGFSEHRNGGMIALLDPAAVDGQGPEPAGTDYHCDRCGSSRPLKMFVMPRSEVNVVSVAPFNRVIVEVLPDRIVARTIEAPAIVQTAIEAIYEFTRDLELTGAFFGGRYWEMHRALEQQGKLGHSREQCPDRNGPRSVDVWTPTAGWTQLSTPRAPTTTHAR